MSKKSKKSADPSSENSDAEVRFDYLKSNYFRVVHADGAVGGLTPSGYIQMNLWSQRLPIPKQTVHQLIANEDGEVNLGAETGRDQRNAIVREIEAGVVLDLSTAIQLRDWLDSQIENAVVRVEHADRDQEEDP